MYCEKLHETDLFKKEYKICSFCCVILHNEDDIKTDNDDNCCDKKELILVDGFQMACQNCGLVDHVIFKNDYTDFYESMYKIRKKSVYIRKYHFRNVLTDIELKNKFPISEDIINRVCKTFDLISTVLHIINKR